MFKVKQVTFLVVLACIMPSISADQSSSKSYTPNVSRFDNFDLKNVAVKTPITRIKNRRFLSGKGYVRDVKTKLVWQDNKASISVKKSWYTNAVYTNCISPALSPPPFVVCNDTSGNTAATYCGKLVIGGYTNWRLPSHSELATIFEILSRNNNLPKEFNYTTQARYWSSTTASNNLEVAYVVAPNVAKAADKKLTKNYIRCVHKAR